MHSLKYKNIIFDFGAVLINIDISLTKKAFTELGVIDFNQIYSHQSQQEIFDLFEKGHLSESAFYESIRKITGLALSDHSIKYAWNALLLDLPMHRIRMLENLNKNHRLFLLSNTNSIHESEFSRTINLDYGIEKFYALFEKVYLSHRIGKKKPDAEIFNQLMQENKLNPEETIFIDDTERHVEGARRAGLHAIHLSPGMDVTELFAEN